MLYNFFFYGASRRQVLFHIFHIICQPHGCRRKQDSCISHMSMSTVLVYSYIGVDVYNIFFHSPSLQNVAASLPKGHNKVNIRTLLQTIVLRLVSVNLECLLSFVLTLQWSQSPSLCPSNASPEDFCELLIWLLYPDHVK